MIEPANFIIRRESIYDFNCPSVRYGSGFANDNFASLCNEFLQALQQSAARIALALYSRFSRR
jgi:hypothetical protein